MGGVRVVAVGLLDHWRRIPAQVHGGAEVPDAFSIHLLETPFRIQRLDPFNDSWEFIRVHRHESIQAGDRRSSTNVSHGEVIAGDVARLLKEHLHRMIRVFNESGGRLVDTVTDGGHQSAEEDGGVEEQPRVDDRTNLQVTRIQSTSFVSAELGDQVGGYGVSVTQREPSVVQHGDAVRWRLLVHLDALEVEAEVVADHEHGSGWRTLLGGV